MHYLMNSMHIIKGIFKNCMFQVIIKIDAQKKFIQ